MATTRLTLRAEIADQLIPLTKVRAQVGLGATRIRELMKAGEFPRCVHIGVAARWSQREIQAWIEARLAER